MTNPKKKTNGRAVHVVLAYKLAGTARCNRVFFEVFSSRNAAKAWCDVVEAEGFKTDIQKKTVVS